MKNKTSGVKLEKKEFHMDMETVSEYVVLEFEKSKIHQPQTNISLRNISRLQSLNSDYRVITSNPAKIRRTNRFNQHTTFLCIQTI